MQEWTNEMWLIAVAAFVIGLIVGYVLLGLTKGSVKKFTQLEKEFKKLKAEKEVKETQLETHFSESAELLSTLAKDYKKLYTHLADSSEKLLPEAQSIELFKELQLESNKEDKQSKEVIDAVAETLEEVEVKEEQVK